MKNTKEIQMAILEKTGLKTSVKKGIGSHKGYFIFSPMFQNGAYPEFPFEWRQEFVKQFEQVGDKFNHACGTQILIFGIDKEEMKFKTERKPTPIEEMKVRIWGSKNSQIRLDKASRRAAKIPLWQKQ
jgi:hypothetical protein